jgi:hypothetical protein
MRARAVPLGRLQTHAELERLHALLAAFPTTEAEDAELLGARPVPMHCHALLWTQGACVMRLMCAMWPMAGACRRSCAVMRKRPDSAVCLSVGSDRRESSHAALRLGQDSLAG